MYKNYLFPIQIFLILEKININLFFSKKNYYNSYSLYTSNKNVLNISYVLKNELFLNTSSLIENSAIDLKYFNNNDDLVLNFFKKYNKILFYNFNIFNSKIKLYLYIFLNSYKSKTNLNSIDKIYPNASWIERETSEMYNIYFYNKKDHRKLMLDYSFNDSPLLKDYPLEGRKQYFFSFFENQVISQDNKYIEI